jgi:hypothetical protein
MMFRSMKFSVYLVFLMLAVLVFDGGVAQPEFQAGQLVFEECPNVNSKGDAAGEELTLFGYQFYFQKRYEAVLMAQPVGGHVTIMLRADDGHDLFVSVYEEPDEHVTYESLLAFAKGDLVGTLSGGLQSVVMPHDRNVLFKDRLALGLIHVEPADSEATVYSKIFGPLPSSETGYFEVSSKKGFGCNLAIERIAK